MKKNIAVVMGGYSSEYQISLQSGNVAYKHLSKRYNAYCVHITKDKWVVVENEQEFPIQKGDFSVLINGNKIEFDCVFNTIHGTPGEDGTIQGYFSMLGIPHTSCDVYQAALTFNKRDTLSVLRNFNIPMAKSLSYNLGDLIDEDHIEQTLGFPCFIKANRSGSSFGVSKVYKKSDIKQAVAVALKEDSEVLMESFLDGIEVSIGVIMYQGKIKVMPATEIVSENDFFDYEAKYKGLSKEITPARISNAQYEELSILAKRIYRLLNMTGFSRLDFIFHENTPHFIEINTNPGLSEMSILPQQAKYDGISLEDLFADAVERVGVRIKK